MHYLSLIWADGRPSAEDLAVMQRELPIWDQLPSVSAIRQFGRELELPQDAVTVRVRGDGGELIVTDGPFAETKEFIAGFDILDCSAPEQAIDFAAECPISQFQPIEVRPFRDELVLDARARAFGAGEDGGARPYLLCPWVSTAVAQAPPSEALTTWRAGLRGRGVSILAGGLAAPGEATTVRVRDGERELTGGPFTRIPEAMTEIAVVSCADREQAVRLAATHPLAVEHAIEVRPFYVPE